MDDQELRESAVYTAAAANNRHIYE